MIIALVHVSTRSLFSVRNYFEMNIRYNVSGGVRSVRRTNGSMAMQFSIISLLFVLLAGIIHKF
jgi:sorbitol-specific phosphotransferase system component IIC